MHRESGPAAPVRLTLTYAGGASTSFSLPGADVKRLAEFLAGAVGEGGT
jgi:trimethylamine:corrinoid methyltransferase-like protein